MKYTTVFFDFDDTLIDTQGYATKCLEKIYAEYDVSRYYPICNDFLTIYHAHTNKLWELYALGEIDKQTLLRDRFYKPFQNIPSIEKSYLDDMNRSFMKHVVNIDTYIDGAKEVLEYLKPKYQIVMLSNGFSELQYDKLESVGFTNYFDDVILSDVIGVNKPHPDIFTFALAKNNVNAKESVMVGDNYLADIKGAMDSQIDQIWYNPQKKEANIEPTHTICRLAEIKNIL